MRKAAINRKLPRYNTGEIAGVLTSFESAHGALSEAKLTLADKLFVATISGSSQARKYLMKFKTKFGVLDGDFAEEYEELLTMLLLWDKKGSLQKQ